MRNHRTYPHFCQHAVDQFISRAEKLGHTTSIDWLQMAYASSKPENNQKSNRITRLNILMRELKHGRSDRRTYKGWRFITQEGKVRTIERIRPYENYIVDRFGLSSSEENRAACTACR